MQGDADQQHEHQPFDIAEGEQCIAQRPSEHSQQKHLFDAETMNEHRQQAVLGQLAKDALEST